MTYSDFFDYDELIKTLINSGKVNEFFGIENQFTYEKDDKLSIEDENNAMLYLAHLSTQTANTLSKLLSNMIYKKCTPEESCIRSSVSIINNILSPSGYLDKVSASYNSQFSVFENIYDSTSNPYMVSPTQFKKFYCSNINNQSNLELYLKALSLVNKTSKMVALFQRYNTEHASKIASAINKKNYHNSSLSGTKPKRYSSSKSDYLLEFDLLLDSSNKLFNSNVPLNVAFINIYSKFLKKEISEDELHQSPEYVEMLKVFKDKNYYNCYLRNSSIYQGIAFERAIRKLYLAKSLFFKKALKEYSHCLENSSNENQTIKCRILKCHDPNIRTNLSGNAYSELIQFVLEGYNAPIQIHIDPVSLSEMESELGISLEKGTINVPFRPSIIHKYTPLTRAKLHATFPTRPSNSRAAIIGSFSRDMISNIYNIPVRSEEEEIAMKLEDRSYNTIEDL